MSNALPGVVLALLADVEKAWNRHLEEFEESDLKHWFPLGLSVTSDGQHVATLYDEGWDFDPPKPKG